MTTRISKIDALTRLGITPEDVSAQPRITDQLKHLSKIVPPTSEDYLLSQDPYYYLQCSDAKEARDILLKYHTSPKVIQRRLPIEAFCLAAGVPTLTALEIIFATAARIAQQHTTLATAIAHLKQPSVVEKSVEYAMTPDGFKDREMLSKATGFLPRPAGTKITVTQNANAVATAAASAAPPPEQTIRRMVDRFNDSKTLKVSSPPAELVENIPLFDEPDDE